MKGKILLVALLVVIILICSGFIAVKILSFGPEQSYFNLRWRYRFVQDPAIRDLLDMHEPGDARADLLGDRYQTIDVEVGIMEGDTVPTSTLEDFAKKVTQVTGKETKYHISDRAIPSDTSSTDEEIKEVIRHYSKDAARDSVLRIIFLKESDSKATLLGQAYDDKNILIFNEALERFTSTSPGSFEAYRFSTLFHEFGHQLGLFHNTTPGCLMNERAEADRKPRRNLEEIVVDFCPYEQGLIANMKY